MDVVQQLTKGLNPIHVLDMHTTGEPTRIILSGYPTLPSGLTLLEQRSHGALHHDHFRRLLILEPRGHKDMYGALLRSETELTISGEAHVGVLFLTNEGYSTMCGHATIALGRFLVDTSDENVFARRKEVKVEMGLEGLEAKINLHAPCGVVNITVPVLDGGERIDPTRPVSFVNVPSFATGIDIVVDLEDESMWPELRTRGTKSIKVDFSYGGAFYCMVSATELGFEDGLRKVDFEAMGRATRLLKATIIQQAERYGAYFRHPEHQDLDFLYSIMVVDKDIGTPSSMAEGAETGLCYFSDQQLDRSPTGSAVAAREALAVAKGERKVKQKWTYHSLVSNASAGKGGFDSEIVDVKQSEGSLPMVSVKVSGVASYIGASTFFVEPEDTLGHDGFVFEKLAN